MVVLVVQELMIMSLFPFVSRNLATGNFVPLSNRMGSLTSTNRGDHPTQRDEIGHAMESLSGKAESVIENPMQSSRHFMVSFCLTSMVTQEEVGSLPVVISRSTGQGAPT